jgi:hypothetical protein
MLKMRLFSPHRLTGKSFSKSIRLEKSTTEVAKELPRMLTAYLSGMRTNFWATVLVLICLLNAARSGDEYASRELSRGNSSALNVLGQKNKNASLPAVKPIAVPHNTEDCSDDADSVYHQCHLGHCNFTPSVLTEVTLCYLSHPFASLSLDGAESLSLPPPIPPPQA